MHRDVGVLRVEIPKPKFVRPSSSKRQSTKNVSFLSFRFFFLVDSWETPFFFFSLILSNLLLLVSSGSGRSRRRRHRKSTAITYHRYRFQWSICGALHMTSPIAPFLLFQKGREHPAERERDSHSDRIGVVVVVACSPLFLSFSLNCRSLTRFIFPFFFYSYTYAYFYWSKSSTLYVYK